MYPTMMGDESVITKQQIYAYVWQKILSDAYKHPYSL